MGKVVIKILQGSAVTQTMLGGLTILQLQISCSVYVPKYENWLAVDKVITKIIRLTFFGPPCTLLRLADRHCTINCPANRVSRET